ncbi:hypothetical protein ACXD4E_000629 [Campylobacter upsaliensis]|uniref:hypothetical protein n=1 Tax=Campylobacter upsaliensis TaxID=28080 RepID=UPI0035300D05
MRIHKALFEVAGSGAGSIHEAQKEVLKELLAKGLKVAVSSRVVAVVWQDSVEDNLLKVL